MVKPQGYRCMGNLWGLKDNIDLDVINSYDTHEKHDSFLVPRYDSVWR
jgi:hypothetical protein